MTDHLQPHQGDQELFEKTGNHIPLCHPCHNTVTTKFDRNYVKGATIEPKSRWLNVQRERHQVIKDKRFKQVKVITYGSSSED